MAQPRKAPYNTFPVVPDDTRSGFICGNHHLDDFLARHALNNDRDGIGKTYVLHPNKGEQNLPAVLGYYTISMASIKAETAAAVAKQKLPKYPVPVALLGRLAVHSDMQGHGIGARLLKDALVRIICVADEIGCLGVIVDAKDENAEQFYQKFGFVSLTAGQSPCRLFMPMKTIKDAGA